MKKIFIAFVIILVVIAGLNSKPSAQMKKVSIATLDFPPISDKNAPGYGFVGELFQTIFDPFEYCVDIEIYPWARGFELAKSGKSADAIFPSIYKKDRENWFTFSDPIITSGYVLITRKDTGITTYKSLNEFKDITIGILRKGITGSIIDSSEFKTEEGKDFNTNIQKLLTKRFDLITGEYLAIMNLINNKYADKKDELIVIEPPISTINFYLMVSKKSPNADEILKYCNEGISLIKKNGTLEKIKLKYEIK